MQSKIKHHRRALLSSLVAGVSILAACGGGSGGKAPEAATDAANQVAFGIEIDHQVERAQATTTSWTPIASEGEAISVPANTTVRYGADGNWVTKVVSGGATCSNEYFGSDPIFGVVKGCEVQGTSTATTSGSTWTWVANEGSNFTVKDNSTVRYGADGYWVSKGVSGQGTCSNEYFGLDPRFATKKACYVQADNVAAPPAVNPPESTVGSANLTWSASPTSGVSRYRVYFGATPHTYAQEIGSGLSAGSTSYSVTGLTSGKTYYFAVTAIDSSGRESTYSNEASAVIK